AFSAALYAFQFVVRYLLRCLFFVSVTQSVYGHQHRDLCNKAQARCLHPIFDHFTRRQDGI
ncbi:hypothetical protein, partial [Acidovorax sp. SUPP2522]|uniref:hypothetical protein n=1 Tax=Acidovorax sp. SUPP2522 TaxID=511900 RepID=UPI0024E0F640